MSAVNRDVTEAASVLACRDLTHSSEPQAAPVPEAPSTGDTARRVAAVFAGAVLVVAAVTGLHGLYRAGGDVVAWSVWVVELLAGMTALGGGIKLIAWGIKPAITAVSVAGKHRLAEPVQAVIAAVAVIAGALGMWWTLRGGYAEWWQHLSGETSWTLLLGIGQMLMAVLAGAALFTGGKYLTGLATEVLTDAGMLGARDRTPGSEGAGAHRNQSRTDRDESVWHPGLVAALIGGGLGLVLLTAGITPRLYVWITGPDVLPAVAAIVAVLVWGVGANLGWWKGLAGLWQWATDASHKAAATSGVVALLMFSAGGLGLGWFTPATVPQAHAQCPPDCGGGSNGSGSYGPDASQFQPPQMPGQMPDYQGGINQPALDQNSSISIYNTQAPSVSNNGVQGSSGQQGPQQSWDQPAHGTQIPDYQNAAPYTQGPGRPNPDFNPGSQGGQANPGSDAGSQGGQPNQGAQQPVQQPQQASQQPTQQDAGQQPNQSPDQSSDQQKIDDLTRQLQEKQQQSSQDRQRIDDLTKQLQQQGQQRQNGNQKLPKAPSKDKKQDDKDQQDRDDQSGDNDLSALLLGAASTRRRKQDEQDSSDQQQPQGPDTQALAQDGAQLGQSLPGDIANTVSDSVNLGQSAGSAAQNFGSAAQAGASLASSAQSGAVNPMDAVALVQGVSGGISDTADAVGSGASIASTWLNNAGQGAQLAADANPQLKAEAEQAQQLTQAGGQVADLTGKVAGGVSQVSGMVNTASSLGTSGMPDTSDVGDATDALSGTATAVNGPGDVPKPTPPTPSQPSSASQLLGNMVGGPQQPTQPAAPGNPNAGSLQGILQPSPSADAVQKQLDLVNQAQDRVKQAQSVVDQSAAQVYMSPQNAPGPDDVKRQGQALFDARRELTDQTLALTEMNQRLIDNGQPPIQIPLLPDNVSRQAFPPEPSKAQEFSGAWSEFSKSTYGIVPDIPTDIRTATNFDQASGADKAALALDGMAIVPGLGAIGRGLKGIEGIRGGEARHPRCGRHTSAVQTRRHVGRNRHHKTGRTSRLPGARQPRTTHWHHRTHHPRHDRHRR
ncbi:putative membrane protein [Mycobacteroides abscessus 1948]|uniref:Putative membrane protein n=1 Tax=Mycobacteroides abscessus 1948 TaxID=1299323 RepID=A0A829QB78_9MYCO|nr:putative membrane protein [Mycobacteroides abscessus 1948]